MKSTSATLISGGHQRLSRMFYVADDLAYVSADVEQIHGEIKSRFSLHCSAADVGIVDELKQALTDAKEWIEVTKKALLDGKKL